MNNGLIFICIGAPVKLVINIPCLNEETTLPLVLAEIPRQIQGVDEIEVQIIDDGSTDSTAEIAKKYGCRVIHHKENLGLGIAFKHGVEAALENGADIMVNTDADNQYPSHYIPSLILPLLNGTADVTIGNRQTWKVKHFSPLKRLLQWLGSASVRRLSNSKVKVSGIVYPGVEIIIKNSKYKVTEQIRNKTFSLSKSGEKEIEIK